ncbi:MAG: hypothetical protein ACI977_000494 [Candidatus Nanohaloarchaea archaeon]|jgi:hypothetical protein
MKPRKKLAKGIVTSHIISAIIAVLIYWQANLFAALIAFALLLPINAYLSPIILRKVNSRNK